ncbi:MAG: hypothetical protein ACPGXL_02895 [Chitinophagales bacterium]
MYDSKLIHILRHLSNKQLKLLEDFIASPYFNKKEEIIHFCTFLMRFKPLFQDARMSKKAAYQHILPHQPYNEKKMSYWMSDFTKLIEQFLVVENINSQPIRKLSYLTRTYLQLNLYKLVQSTLKTTTKQQRKNPLRDADFYFNQFMIHRDENLFFDRQNLHLYDDSLQKAIDNLDIYYLSRKLKYCCEMVSRQNIVASQYELRMLDEILLYLKKNPHNDIPPIAIYSTILLTLLEAKEEKHFVHLKDLLKQYNAVFPKSDAYTIYMYAINYCIKQVNGGNETYLNDLFQLYQELLKTEIIFENKKEISPWAFTNIVGVGVRNKAYDWTENFIADYKNNLPIHFRKSVYSYNLSYLFFYQKKYTEAQSLLQHIEFDTVLYSINARSLLLRIYYELDELDAFLSLVDSFKMYLKRNKLISQNRKEQYLKFVKYTAKLHKTPRTAKAKLRILKEELAANRNTANASWLLEKIEERLNR